MGQVMEFSHAWCSWGSSLIMAGIIKMIIRTIAWFMLTKVRCRLQGSYKAPGGILASHCEGHMARYDGAVSFGGSIDG